MQGEAAEAAGIDEAKVAAGLRDRTAWVCGGMGTSAAETSRRPVMPRWTIHCRGVLLASEVEDDVLADAMYEVDAGAGEGFGHGIGRSLEGLLVATEPDGENSLATDAFVDAAGDGFDFGEFGHPVLIFAEEPDADRARASRLSVTVP